MGFKQRHVPKPQREPELRPEHLVPGQLNVVVFGPGHGEAILMVFPDGSVGVIDGCRERGDPMRAILRRMDDKGLEDGQKPLRIRFVCLTHPHDDHYAGLGRLLEAYDGRVEQVWSPFQTGDRYAHDYYRYLQLTKAPQYQPDRDNFKGLSRVLRWMRHRHSQTVPVPKVVIRGMPLLDERIGGKRLQIRAVGPTTRDIETAHDKLVESLAQWTDEGEKPKERYDPNQASGALLVQWGAARVLLAGDLTNGNGDPQRGWELAQKSIRGPVHVVNVAHHASRGAHHDKLCRR